MLMVCVILALQLPRATEINRGALGNRSLKELIARIFVNIENRTRYCLSFSPENYSSMNLRSFTSLYGNVLFLP